MRPLSDTIARLSKLHARAPLPPPVDRLTPLSAFGANPGVLAAKVYVPTDLPDKAALVVVLHGCTQTAAGYDYASGWSRLAEEYGFVVLYPEQSRANNANLCFNWFVGDDIKRGQGEAKSIAEMIDAVCRQHPIDQRRVYITGLSAGGAMANVMLATYPELFAGGAIIAGLPYGVAGTIPEAFDRMRGHGIPTTSVMQRTLRDASQYHGPLPTVSVWHGTADRTVALANADAIVEQWMAAQNIVGPASVTNLQDGLARTAWKDGGGQVAIEQYRITGMSHGTPLDVSTGTENAAPFMVDVGVSSTRLIAHSWGLTPSFERRQPAKTAAPHDMAKGGPAPAAEHSTSGIQKVIEDALRAAGLMG
ncbi:extracellular catalytic domain type 1 short-chain-length polyhydroxyalkanoate depolymerase [Rhizobium grahamii]|uniref:Polyhydroxybutyrate depolymerase n=1 Tax=Rhizobium grahamii CCGE 502 TaxID=990285 RepID=S3HDQ5_9HYPH|nr:PHB depolymerase family esterase [Rhizobium grahamii]EPE96185.1 polyhydroxybutyrate depolymerase [Rhizobium grahamii CCGE 502]